MSKSSLFKWRHYQPDIILCCMRWYLSYPLSYRQVEELITERGLPVDHSTVFRWVQHYSPELDKRCRHSLRPSNDSGRVDETYIKVKGKWKYLYRAVDSAGNTAPVFFCLVWWMRGTNNSPFCRANIFLGAAIFYCCRPQKYSNSIVFLNCYSIAIVRHLDA